MNKAWYEMIFYGALVVQKYQVAFLNCWSGIMSSDQVVSKDFANGHFGKCEKI